MQVCRADAFAVRDYRGSERASLRSATNPSRASRSGRRRLSPVRICGGLSCLGFVRPNSGAAFAFEQLREKIVRGRRNRILHAISLRTKQLFTKTGERSAIIDV